MAQDILEKWKIQQILNNRQELNKQESSIGKNQKTKSKKSHKNSKILTKGGTQRRRR
jgi:hypothetical protein